MNSSSPFQSGEPNLFQFHFDSASYHQPSQDTDQGQSNTFQNRPQPIYTSFENQTTFPLDSIMFSSPQLKPTQPMPYHRKRFKTIESNQQPKQLITPCIVLNQTVQSESENPTEKEDDDEEDDDGEESGSECESNEGSLSSSKRGKYKVYSDSERLTIISFMMKHGMQKTLEIFSGSTHKLTKRKLKSWIDNQHKVKGVKGRKTNDPSRDQNLYEWCLTFQRENDRSPTRKETTKRALELSEDSSFQASKGWLDKFSRKYNMEFTPLKITSLKNKKKDGFSLDSDSGSTLSKSDSSAMEAISPLSQAVLAMQAQHLGQDFKMKPLTFESYVTAQGLHNEYETPGIPTNSFLNFNNGNNTQAVQGIPFGLQNSVSSVEPVHYQQQVSTGMNYNYEYTLDPLSYHFDTKMEYPMGNNGNYGQTTYVMNNQMSNDMNGFMNAKANWESDGFMSDQMRVEYPY